MNDFSYEQLQIGQEEHFDVTVTDEMMTSFRKLSGDTNPLHCDGDYAVSKGFTDRVVYGMLTSSFYSTLAGVYLPGRNCLLYGLDIAFHKPVYVGMQLTVSGTVREKNDTFRMITVKASITNQNGDKVSKSEIKIGFVG